MDLDDLRPEFTKLAADLRRRTGISVTEYDRPLLLIVAGVVVFVGGGLAVELLAPTLVHWVHDTGALAIVAGFVGVSLLEFPIERWFVSVVSDPARHRPREEWM